MILLALLFALLAQEPPPPLDARATLESAKAQATWSVDRATAMAPTLTPQPTRTPTPTTTPTPLPTLEPEPTWTPQPTPADTATPQPTWTPQVPIIIVPTVVVVQAAQVQGEKVERWPDWVIAAAFGVSVLLIAGGVWLYFKWRRE
jgi:hypothetical protein